MALIRTFSKVDKEGHIAIPKNVRRETGLKEGQLVEIKVQGGTSPQYITIKAYNQGRKNFIKARSQLLSKGRC